MLNTFQVDWDQSTKRMITSDGGDLPANVKAFQAEALTPEVLAKAVKLFESPVQVVQIEVPEDKELVSAAKALEQLDDEDLILPHSTLFSGDTLANYFARFAGQMCPEQLDKLLAFSRNAVGAVVDNYGQETVNEFAVFREEAVGYPTYSFHSHVYDDKRTPEASRAFYLTRPLADISTVFVDRDDLSADSLINNALEAGFRNPKPDLWFAKPGSYLLFATVNHAQGPCFHASPPNQPSRTIPIVNFFVPYY